MAIRTFAAQTQPQLFDSSVVAGKYRFTFSDGQVFDVDMPVVTVTFTTPGDFTVMCARLDVNGVTLAAGVSAPFNIPAPVSIDVPVTVTVAA